MSRQNVTLSLSEEMVREARHLAVDKGVSLSRYLSELLEQHISGSKDYAAARDRQLQLLSKGLDLQTRDKISWTRESLHDR